MLIGSLLRTLCPRLAGMALVLVAVPSAGGQASRCGDPDPEISISACSAIIQGGGGSGRDLAVAHTQRGIAYVALLDYDRALQDFAQAIARDSRFSKAFANRGAVHGARQDFDKAIADFTQVLALEPTAPAYADRASMYRLNGQYDEAIRDYSEAIQRDPLFVDAILNRATTLAGTSRCSEAIPDFTRVIELAAGGNGAHAAPIAYVDRGVCHESAGREDLALKDYSEHLLLDPRSSYGLERRAALLFRTGQHERALADYAQAVVVNPSSAVALYGRGLVKRLKGDTAGGDADIAAAAALRPGIAEQMAARGVKP